VIIAAGPRTSRKGLSDRRSITTPSAPEKAIVTANATASVPASASPASTVDCPESPNACKVHMATKDPTMKTLKCAKLISSRMP
jgi:hypothetical protein